MIFHQPIHSPVLIISCSMIPIRRSGESGESTEDIRFGKGIVDDHSEVGFIYRNRLNTSEMANRWLTDG